MIDILSSSRIDKLFPQDEICFNFTNPAGVSLQNLTNLTEQEKLNCERDQLCRNQLDRGFAPLEFFFLLFYLILIGIQFFSMILHRIQTLVHWLGHNDATDDLWEAMCRHKRNSDNQNDENFATSSKYTVNRQVL